MNFLSKLLCPELSINNECYQVWHQWTPFCTEAALEVGLNSFKEAFKMYFVLYLVRIFFFNSSLTSQLK